MVAYSIVSGIILGSSVEPYQFKLVPDLIQWRVAANGLTADQYLVADE